MKKRIVVLTSILLVAGLIGNGQNVMAQGDWGKKAKGIDKKELTRTKPGGKEYKQIENVGQSIKEGAQLNKDTINDVLCSDQIEPTHPSSLHVTTYLQIGENLFPVTFSHDEEFNQVNWIPSYKTKPNKSIYPAAYASLVLKDDFKAIKSIDGSFTIEKYRLGETPCPESITFNQVVAPGGDSADLTRNQTVSLADRSDDPFCSYRWQMNMEDFNSIEEGEFGQLHLTMWSQACAHTNAGHLFKARFRFNLFASPRSPFPFSFDSRGLERWPGLGGY